MKPVLERKTTVPQTELIFDSNHKFKWNQPQEKEISTSATTLRSVYHRIKRATDLSLARVEELCALLTNWTQLESTEIAKRPVRDLATRHLNPRVTGTIHGRGSGNSRRQNCERTEFFLSASNINPPVA